MPQRSESSPERSRLSRDRILRAALEVAEQDGLEAVTMRRLGRELGVEAMALYYYVESKDALLDGLVELAVSSMDTSGMRRGPWEERLKAGFRAYRSLALEYPAVFPLVGRRRVSSLAALRPVEIALGVLRGAGFGPREALRAFRTLSSFAYGYALSELRGFAIESASKGDRPAPETLAAEAENFPNLAEVIQLGGAPDHDADFEHGLDAIIAGLKTVHGVGGQRRNPGARRRPQQ